MANANFRKNTSIVSKLLLEAKVKEERDKQAKKLEEGTPTTALPPESNATRQLDRDVALSSNKSGVPNGIGSPDPSDTQNPVQLGPNSDPPTDSQQFNPGPQISGMQKPITDPFGPSTISMIPGTPGQAPPATATQELPPESNATRQLDRDVALAKNKFGIPTMEAMAEMNDKTVVEAFVEFMGGVDRATFALIADGCPLTLAEAIIGGKLSKIDEAIRSKIADIVEIDINQHAKSGNASPGFKKWYSDRVKKKPEGHIDLKPNNSANRDKPWSATSKEGHDARRNK